MNLFCLSRHYVLLKKKCWFCIHRNSVIFFTVNIWYSFHSFNILLNAFSVMSRKPFRKEYIKRKGLAAGIDGEEGYRVDVAGYRGPQGS